MLTIELIREARERIAGRVHHTPVVTSHSFNEVAGKQVFAADFEPAVSANPYIQFKFKATESGPVVLTWIDDDGSKIVGEEKITVT